MNANKIKKINQELFADGSEYTENTNILVEDRIQDSPTWALQDGSHKDRYAKGILPSTPW